MAHRSNKVGSTRSDRLDDNESMDDSSTDEVISVFEVTQCRAARPSTCAANKRIEEFSSNHDLPSCCDVQLTQFSGIMFDGVSNKWKGKYSTGKTEGIAWNFVKKSFSKAFIIKCYNHPSAICKVVCGSPKKCLSPGNQEESSKPVYQQLNNYSCVLSSAASAFRYFNDNNTHLVLQKHILSSVLLLDRFEFV